MALYPWRRFYITSLLLQIIIGHRITILGQQIRKDEKILVLGAGISGIKAAKTLHDAGYPNVEIIEGSDRIGGRIKESQLGQYTVEDGALWINGKGSNPIWTLSQQYNISTIPDVDEWKVFKENGDDVTEAADALYETSFEPATEKTVEDSVAVRQGDYPDFSVRASLREEGWLLKSVLDDAIEYNVYDYEYGTIPEEISTKYGYFTETFVTHGDSSDVVVKDTRGYAHIVRSMAAEFLVENDPRLHLNEIVTSIDRSEDGVTVRTSKANYTCDYVIVTFSLGVLQHKQVSFSPPLPEWKQDAIDQFSMVLFEHLYFQFPTKFWDDEPYFVYASSRRGYYNAWFNIDYVHPGSNILHLTVSKDEAKRLARISDAAVIDEAVAVLQTIFKNVTVPRPTGIVFNRWATDPLFYGAFSNWPVGYDMDRYHALVAPVDRIYFAGEYAADLHFAYTNGAYYSGEKTADDLMTCISNPFTCTRYEPPPAKVLGCTYTLSKNYDRSATQDDGSCTFRCSVSLGDCLQPSVSGLVLLIITLYMNTILFKFN